MVDTQFTRAKMGKVSCTCDEITRQLGGSAIDCPEHGISLVGQMQKRIQEHESALREIRRMCANNLHLDEYSFPEIDRVAEKALDK